MSLSLPKMDKRIFLVWSLDSSKGENPVLSKYYIKYDTLKIMFIKDVLCVSLIPL